MPSTHKPYVLPSRTAPRPFAPTHGEMARLNWPEWLVIYRNRFAVPEVEPWTRSLIPVLTGPSVEQLSWSRSTRYITKPNRQPAHVAKMSFHWQYVYSRSDYSHYGLIYSHYSVVRFAIRFVYQIDYKVIRLKIEVRFCLFAQASVEFLTENTIMKLNRFVSLKWSSVTICL